MEAFCCVSHCWETPEELDPQRVQQRLLLKHITGKPSVKCVWLDYWCCPQGKESIAKRADEEETY